MKSLYDELNGVRVTNGAVKCLGIYIGHDKLIKNWTKVYHDVEKLFESWTRRKLSLFGKCTIITTLVLSKLLYIANILELPETSL